TQDRHVLEQGLRWEVWLLFAFQEARLSLKRWRTLVFGDRAKQRPPKPPAGGGSARGDGPGGLGTAPAEAPVSQTAHASTPPSPGERRRGRALPGLWVGTFV